MGQHPRSRAPRPRGASGFTLVEILLAIGILSLTLVAIGSVTFSFSVIIGGDAKGRLLDGTTAQFVARVFARDVQGAAGLGAECAASGSSVRLVTLVPSDGTGNVEYRRAATAPFDLVRTDCATGASSVIVHDLAICPSVEFAGNAATATTTTTTPPGGCAPVPTAPSSAPRRVTLHVGRTSSFAFDLDGTRRPTDANRVDPPLEAPDFMSLGGDTPLSVGGTSRLQVVGNAYINRPSSGPGVAVNLNGSAQLDVSGAFDLQSGGTCPNCSSRANKMPGTFANRLPDPLRYLPAPDTSMLTTQTSCPVQGGVHVCQPGIYPGSFPPAGGGVKDFRLAAGVYVLRGGMKVTNGSIDASAGVLLYGEQGDVDVTGAELNLHPPTSGIYNGIVYFQARDNAASFKLVGNAALASVVGTIYVPAPASAGVVLGGGGGTLRVGRVIGSKLSTSGSGTVIVDGS